MKRFTPLLALWLLVVGLSGARAAEPLPDGWAESAFRAAFPKVRVDSVHPTPVEGLYEVVAGENVLYFAPATGHLLFGELWSREGASLTAARQEHLLAEKVARLPLDRAVRLGDGPTVVIEVTDPDCPFCRRGSDYLETRSDVTRYVFFHPLPSHPQARAKAQYILAAPDPAAAYAEVFSGRYDEDPLPEFEPNSRLEEHVRLVEELGIRGTPHYWIGGEHVAGADLDAIRNLLP
jgi:thiol:disulfide interchange protein DsbC